ncbi:hypothetical protein PR048_024558 [Dryococelus australis]|uniref:rRNA adenine N(6)-methyltransferase n=1 Tax=Dryococelus australis TaxID=614101 RepID=A0ABQ9GNX3_9NEOP|nr:hypothetical protein PR048_024558 [Dryococelus australis]
MVEFQSVGEKSTTCVLQMTLPFLASSEDELADLLDRFFGHIVGRNNDSLEKTIIEGKIPRRRALIRWLDQVSKITGRPFQHTIRQGIKHLTCDGTAGYLLYRTSSVLFQLIFEWEILTKVPRKALFPWHTGYPDKKFTKLSKVQSVNAEWVYLVKCVPRRDFFDAVVPSEQLQQLLFFVRHNMSSRHNRVIPQLERWIPGCGPRVISKGMTIFSRFGDLSPQEILSLFRDFASWPEYSECPFQASIEYAYLKMEPGSEDLDETPTQSQGIEEVEVDDETDHELLQ